MFRVFYLKRVVIEMQDTKNLFKSVPGHAISDFGLPCLPTPIPSPTGGLYQGHIHDNAQKSHEFFWKNVLHPWGSLIDSVSVGLKQNQLYHSYGEEMKEHLQWAVDFASITRESNFLLIHLIVDGEILLSPLQRSSTISWPEIQYIISCCTFTQRRLYSV